MEPRPASPKPRVSEDRTQGILCYFIERLSGSIGRTRLAKLVYLADLEARRYLGAPISSFTYVLNQRGPFDARLFNVLDGLKDRAEVVEQVYPMPSGVGYAYHASRPVRPHSFTPAEQAVLAYVLRSYARTPLEDLLQDVVYETEPMQRVDGKPLGTPLPMECVDNSARIALGGIDLENALRGEEEVRLGKTVKWEELRRELLDRTGRERGGEDSAIPA